MQAPGRPACKRGALRNRRGRPGPPYARCVNDALDIRKYAQRAKPTRFWDEGSATMRLCQCISSPLAVAVSDSPEQEEGVPPEPHKHINGPANPGRTRQPGTLELAVSVPQLPVLDPGPTVSTEKEATTTKVGPVKAPAEAPGLVPSSSQQLPPELGAKLKPTPASEVGSDPSQTPVDTIPEEQAVSALVQSGLPDATGLDHPKAETPSLPAKRLTAGREQKHSPGRYRVVASSAVVRKAAGITSVVTCRHPKDTQVEVTEVVVLGDGTARGRCNDGWLTLNPNMVELVVSGDGSGPLAKHKVGEYKILKKVYLSTEADIWKQMSGSSPSSSSEGDERSNKRAGEVVDIKEVVVVSGAGNVERGRCADGWLTMSTSSVKLVAAQVRSAKRGSGQRKMSVAADGVGKSPVY